jgi:lysophospholipase L1-like esterase
MNKEAFTILFILISSILMAQHPAATKQLKYLALGDSYTIGESVAEDQRWPVQLVKALTKEGNLFGEPKIIATTGWRTDDLKNAIFKEKPSTDYDLVSLLIGVNNQYQGKSAEAYAPEFEELLKMAIAFAGGDKSKVFVVSIPDYGFTPFGKDKQEKITKELNEFNRVNKEIASKLGVKYFNITEISRRGVKDPELIANDGLHPSGKMYEEWTKLIAGGL